MKVDVVVLTKNSQRYIDQCLSSIYENVPVNKLIIVDGYSADNTLDIIKEYSDKMETLILLDEVNRATATQKAIKNITTEWFMNVDSDVTLCDGWFQKAQRLIEPDIGMIWGYVKQMNPQGRAMLEAMYALYKIIGKEKAVENKEQREFKHRGATHDVLIRLKAVENIKIPPQLHFYEDMYIKNWVEKQGYKAIATPSPYCFHYGSLTASRKELVISGTLGRQLGLINRGQFIKRLVISPFRAIWVSAYARNLTVTKNVIRNDYYPCAGWLKSVFVQAKVRKD